MKFTVDVIYGGELLNDLKKSVRLNASQEINRHLFKLVFLCGKELSGENSTNPCNRRKVKGFLKRHRNDVKCINVEKLTEKLLDQEKLNLLTFEEFIAALSDAIILFAESWGSVCELGAFSASDSLARKMVVINDKQHINSLSFVSQGPIAKI